MGHYRDRYLGQANIFILNRSCRSVATAFFCVSVVRLKEGRHRRKLRLLRQIIANLVLMCRIAAYLLTRKIDRKRQRSA